MRMAASYANQGKSRRRRLSIEEAPVMDVEQNATSNRLFILAAASNSEKLA
jgi:hypothetical protein